MHLIQVRGISEIIWNTNSGYQYNPQTLDNDFVILKLDSPLELNNDVKPACLPAAGYLSTTETEERCFTSGWGTLSSGLYFFSNLESVNGRTQLLNCQWNSSDIDTCQMLKYQSSEP